MNFLCVTCGTQFAESGAAPPARCAICDDERQYVPVSGQKWTTLPELRAEHQNRVHEEEPGLFHLLTEPSFGINQRAFLLQSPAGNILWDCISLIDDVTVAAIRKLGGIKAVAISHPHYYTTMVEWSHAFDAPIYLHEEDQQWVMRPDPAIRYWQGDRLRLHDGFTLIHCGGHFAGGTVLHWEERRALFPGDVIQVVPSRRVSFMYSYPNLIPLDAVAIKRIVNAVAPFGFDRIFGAFGHTVPVDGNAVVEQSAERYLRAIGA